jgi:CO dehydrogenase nickel-insertion accessory protein CooC1
VALVANKLRDERDEEAVAAFADRNDLDIAGRIPFDELFVEAERAGMAPLDLTPESATAPGVAAIARLAAEWGIDGRA